MFGQFLKRSALFAPILAALVFAGPAAPSSPVHVADQATAYHEDATHDGYIADAGLAAPLTQAWSITLPGAVSYPLIVNGVVYVTTATQTLYAINQATGNTIWSHATGSQWSGIAYDRGQIFLVNGHGALTAFDAATGSVAWSDLLPGQNTFDAPPTAVNGIVYTSGVGTGGTVYAAREADGALLWTHAVDVSAGGSPAVTADGVYLTYGCQTAYDLDPLSGTQLWAHSPPPVGPGCEDVQGKTGVVADGHVYTRESSVGHIVLSASTGAQEGTFGPVANLPVAPAVANGAVYAIAGGTLTAAGADGLGTANLWFNGDGFLDTAPIVADGLVFVGSSAGNLYALNGPGAAIWSTNVGAAIPATDEYNSAIKLLPGLAAANGTLVVSAGSTLVAYRTAGAIATAPVNQGAPSVDGSAELNGIEAADVGVWSGLPTSYAYQWELCDASGANCADVDGATDATYVPPVEDYGQTVRVRVTATNGIGSSSAVESAASAVLGLSSAAPKLSTLPTVDDTATVGQPISTTAGTWTNSPTTFAYKWQRCNSTGSNCADIANATSSQYTPVEADAGSELRSEVLASNAVGSASGYAVSAPTSAVISTARPAIVTFPADEATAYQIDATHDGYIADAGLTAPLTKAWSVNLPGAASYPLIVNGVVYVTAANKTVYALNQATGATIWSHPIGGNAGKSGLAYDRGRVFVLNYAGVLTAFDAASGAVAWTEQLPGPAMVTAPPTATNGIVYVAGAPGSETIDAVDEGDGHFVWTQSVPVGENSSPAVTAHGVYVSYWCQHVYDLDPLSGGQIWQHTSSCFTSGGWTPVVAGNHVYARDPVNGNLVLSAATGASQGTFNAGSAPAVANGVAFLSNDSLSATEKAGLGNDAWRFAGDGQLNLGPAPVVAGGLVFAGSAGGHLYALDATTGAVAWSTNVGAAISGPDDLNSGHPIAGLAAANGTLVASAGNTLLAYRSAGAITTPPSNLSPPTVGGSPDLNGLQAADVGIWSGLPSSYAYQWELCDENGANCSDIAGATGESYLPPAGSAGMTLRVKVTATNGIGSSNGIRAARPFAVATDGGGSGVQSPASASAPVVIGTPALGVQLSTTNGVWTNSPTSYTYKWQRCASTGANCTDIANATGSHYTVVAADQGHAVRSEVRAINGAGAAVSYAPSPPEFVPGAPVLSSAPVVRGKAVLHLQLSTTAGVWKYSPSGYAYRWQRCDKTGANCVNIPNATHAQYTLVAADVGHKIRSAVLATNAVGAAASGYASSMPTAVVATHKPVVLRLPRISGLAKVGSPLYVTTSSWKYAPTSFAYQWLRCTALGTGCKTIVGATSSSYVLTAADVGHKLKAKVTAVNAAGSVTVVTPNTSATVKS